MLQYSFYTLESIFYDLRVKLNWNGGVKNDYILVTMDEESDQFLGESYPYAYATHNRLIEKITKEKPLGIGYLVNLQEASSENEKSDQLKFKNIVQNYIKDDGIFRFGTEMDIWGEQIPPSDLGEIGFSLSLLNRDTNSFAKDGVVRRAILNTSGEDTFHLWMSNTIRKKNGLKTFNALDYNGSYYSKEADAVFALFKYFSNPIEKNKHVITIPFHRIVVGNYSKGIFKDKIVLIGPQYLSNSDDFLNTPFNKENADVSKLSIHAQIIQALISEHTVYLIPKSVTNVLAVIISIILSLLISRIRPTSGLIITVGSLIAVILSAYLLFVIWGLWLYFSQLILSIFIVYYIWVPFRAIAEYQSRYAIEEEAKILKEVDHLKHNFISFMSHDLKTPVAKIAGIVDILLTQYETKGEQKIHLERILASTKELDKFITSILDLTKIESKNIKLIKTSKDINKIITDVVKTLQFELNTKKMTLDLQLAPMYPILLDLDLTKRVISNLVENAIKYSGEGKSIVIKTWDDADWVYVEISDNGIGMKETDLVHIFEKFYRVKNDDSHKIKGSGLGLYLVKYFVELHDGKISATSEVGKGTSFVIKFKNQG